MQFGDVGAGRGRLQELSTTNDVVIRIDVAVVANTITVGVDLLRGVQGEGVLIIIDTVTVRVLIDDDL